MVLLLTITMMDIGVGGNDKDALGRIGTHDGAPPYGSKSLRGDLVVFWVAQ
jgi:hypothetical protein